MANQSDATVKVELPSIDQLIAAIGTEKLKIIMSGAATVVAGEVRKRWAKGIGASGQNMEAEQPISKVWKEQKALGGRQPKINYAYHGDFAQSFRPREIRDNGRTVVITFDGNSKGIKYIRKDGKDSKAKPPTGPSNLEKARGLAYWRPHSFKPDDSLELIGAKAFDKSLRAIVKFTK